MGSERKRINHIAIIEERPSQINSSAEVRKARTVHHKSSGINILKFICLKVEISYLGISWGVNNK